MNLSEPTALTLSFQGRAEAQLQFMTRQVLICILLLSIAITPLLSIKIPADAQLCDNYGSPAVTDTILRHQRAILFAVLYRQYSVYITGIHRVTMGINKAADCM